MIRRYTEPIYKNDKKVSSCAGTQEIPEYQLDYKADGGVRLIQKGVKPIYKLIQAQKVNCDLQAVLEACVHENQLSVCNIDDVQQAIVDFSGMQNMAELYAGMKHLDNTWNSMPIEVRNQFGSSQAAFVHSLQSPDFIEKLETGFSAYDKANNKRIQVPKPTVEEPSPAPTPESIPEPAGGDD